MRKDIKHGDGVIPQREKTGNVGALSRLNPYSAYKDSGVEWLGEVPAHWEISATKRVCRIVNGATPKSAESRYWNGDIPWITPEDLGDLDQGYILSSKRKITWEGYQDCGTTMVPVGSLVLSTRAPIGHLGIAGVKLCTNQGCRSLVFRYKRSEVYYFFQLSACRVDLEALGQGSTFSELSNDRLGDFEIAVPPLPEQRAIAAFLDYETAKIDALVAKKERLIELLQEKRTALISDAVTKGLDPDVPLKDSGVEWLGEIPAHWIGLPLKRWVAVKITDGPHETPQFVPDGVDFISAEAVSNRKINFDKRRGFISPELHTYYSRKCKPIRDDILICKSGATTGKLARVDTDHEFGIWSPLAVVRSNRSRIIPRFLEMALEAEYVQNQIKRTWSAGTQPNISMGDLERLHVVAPNIEEQRKILAYVASKTDGFSPIIAKVQEAIDRLKELRTALISAAVTGKIDVREAAA